MSTYIKTIESNVTKAALVGVALVMSFAAIAVSPKKAGATIGSCTAWQYSAHSKSRECATTTSGVIAVQYDDYGPNDGYCVNMYDYDFTVMNGWGWRSVIGSTSESQAKNLSTQTSSPKDCTQNSVTTFYVDVNAFNPVNGNLAIWRVNSTGGLVDYNTTCMSNPARPAVVSGKPYCYNVIGH